jgi:hypothetical protein
MITTCYSLNYMIAIALLTAEPSAPIPEWVKDNQRLIDDCSKMAVMMEILDPREQRYTFRQTIYTVGDLQSDFKLVRKRYEELKDAPPVADIARFPTRSFCNDVLGLNRAYLAYLKQQQELYGKEDSEIRYAIQETEHLYTTWDNMRDAGCDYYYLSVRRQAMMKLRKAIGWDAYYKGILPPFVPLQCFGHID